MITVDQARARIAADLRPLATEIVGLGDALGRVLGEDGTRGGSRAEKPCGSSRARRCPWAAMR
jgi:hypothetical protein